MEKIKEISGKVIPLAMDNVDTDLIIPAQYLTAITKPGNGDYGKNLFKRLCEADPDFVFNQKKFIGANILIAQENFGCGSSREHAVWALQEAGIQAVIAYSFADIFFNNAAKSGLLLMTLSKNIVNKILQESVSGNLFLTIDIENQTINPAKNERIGLYIDPFRKHCLLNGLDDLDYLLSHKKIIERYSCKKQ